MNNEIKGVNRIRALDIEKLKQVVAEEYTYQHVVERFGIEKGMRSTTMYKALRKIMDDNDIDYSHFGHKRLKILSEQLIENSTYNVQTLKKRLIKENLIPYECECCKNKGEWMGRELILQLDHKNGIHNDNRLENLRFLCANCHSQTETFSGKNVKKKMVN